MSLTVGSITASATSGLLVLTGSGLAGEIAGAALSGLPSSIGFTGSFDLRLNTTTAAVAQQFQLAGSTVDLNLPAGPYLRIEGDGAGLTVAGQTVSGNFVFERVTDSSGTVVRVSATNVSASLG